MKNNAAFSLASVVLTSAIATAMSSTAIASEDEHREHGAHEHGKAQLNVVVEKSELAIMLETPAMNVFGFEHEPKNEKQKEAVEHAVEDLNNIVALIKTDKGAECKIAKVDVDQPFAKHDEHDEHEHEEKDDHDHDEHKAKEKHDDHDHDEKHEKEHDDHDDHDKHEGHDDHDEDEESAHSDIDVEVSYKCGDADKLTQLDLTALFKRFPGFEDIDAQIITNGQQSAAELTKDQPVLVLKK